MELFEHCRGCARYLRSCSGMSKEVCKQHDLRVPITNADRIRGMNDEELAEYFSPKACPTSITAKGHCTIPTDCKQCWLDWLKQEVSQ